MASRVLAVFVLLVAVCSAASPLTQLLNALIANSGINDRIASTYASFQVGNSTNCGSPSWPAAADIPSNIRICSATSNVYPYNDGALGLEVDLVNTFSTQLLVRYPNKNVTISWIPVTTPPFYDNLKAALNAGICDTIIADIFQNSARDADFEASCGYATVAPAFVRGTLNSSVVFNTIADLNNTVVRTFPLKLGFVSSSVYESIAKSFANVEVYTYNGTRVGMQAVSDEKLHAFFSDAATIQSFLATNCSACTIHPFTPVYNLVAYTKVTTGNTTGTTGATTGSAGSTTGSGNTNNNSGGSTTNAASAVAPFVYAVVAVLAALAVLV